MFEILNNDYNSIQFKEKRTTLSYNETLLMTFQFVFYYFKLQVFGHVS